MVERRPAGKAGALAPLLAEATAALRRNAIAEAEALAHRAVDIDAGHPEALNLLGMAALARGRGSEAAGLFEAAIRRAPTHAMLRCNLAFAYRQAGRPEEAVREAAEAARLDPKLTPAHAVLGSTLFDLGRPAEALAPLQQALALSPGLPRVVHTLGETLLALGRDGEAQAHFESAVAADPGQSDAWSALGGIHTRARRTEDAVRCFKNALATRRASAWWPGRIAAVPPRATTPANLMKLDHDIEQLAYLDAHGLLPGDAAATIAGYRDVRKRIAAAHDASVNLALSREELGPIAGSFGRVLRWRETPALSGSVLGSFDRGEVEARYAAPPGVTWVDGLLSPEALAALRAFCLESTIWNDIAHNFQQGGVARAYLGTYMADGFCCPLLFQIAEALTRAMPAIFKDHALHQMWAYKYQAQTEGIALHGDDAAVNVNFWLTPDDANLDPDSGGLVVYPVEAPRDWNFADINRYPEKIREFLDASGVAPVNVAHRQNRAVIFNSDLFHATAPLRFKPGYENRRINVTMLFGKR